MYLVICTFDNPPPPVMSTWFLKNDPKGQLMSLGPLLAQIISALEYLGLCDVMTQ